MESMYFFDMKQAINYFTHIDNHNINTDKPFWIIQLGSEKEELENAIDRINYYLDGHHVMYKYGQIIFEPGVQMWRDGDTYYVRWHQWVWDAKRVVLLKNWNRVLAIFNLQ